MKFAEILCVIGMNEFRADLDAVTALCRSADARLKLLLLSTAMPPAIGGYGEFLSDDWLAERQDDVRKLKQQEDAVRAALATTDISWAMEGVYTELALAESEIARQALFADLTFMGAQAASHDGLRRHILSGSLYHAPTPVLFAPASSRTLTLSPAVALAGWSATRESAAAFKQALPALVKARDVRLTLVDPEVAVEGDEPGAEAAALLARHDVRVTVDVVSAMGRSKGEALLKHAADTEAELLVMGAYGHSRLRERLFGGVTEWILDNSPLPVFLAR